MGALTLTSSGGIADGESVTNWVGDTFSLEPDLKVEGSNSVACTQTNNGTNDIYFSGSWDLSNKHIRLFWNITYVGNMSATDPVEVFLYDGTTTEYITYFAANTDYAGGWVDLLVDTELFTTLTLTSITQVGIRVNTSTKPRNVPGNCWVDNWRYSNGMQIYSSTTEAVSFKDAADLDATSVYGVLSDIDGVLFAAGEIVLGMTGSQNANIVSVNETIVFPDRQVATTLYKLKTQEGTGNTDIDITGLFCKTVGGSGAEIDISSTLNTLSMVSCSFIDMGTITITPTVTTPTFDTVAFTGCGTTAVGLAAVGCTWDTCALVTHSTTSVLTGCIFKNASGAIALDIADLDYLDDCTFISDGTGHAVDLGTISASDTMGWNCTNSGYAATDGSTGNETIKVTINSPNVLTINKATGASTPTIMKVGTGTVNVVVGQRTLSFTVDPSITGYEWRLYEKSATVGTIGTVELDGEETATVDNQSYVYSYSVDTDVVIQIIAAGYEESLTYLSLVDANQSRTITLTPETNT